jgi:sporulation protein YlmC with PRC-barrel domain
MGTLFPGRDPPRPPPVQTGAAIDAGAPDDGVIDGASMSCATLQGEPVVNRRGEELGELQQIALDRTSGTIAYAILVRGGVFGLGERLHAIPWKALEFDRERNRFVLNIESERLDGAPGFDDDHWPPLTDPAWASSVHDFYAVTPSEALGAQDRHAQPQV